MGAAFETGVGFDVKLMICSAGVEFIADNGEGPGVRLRKVR
jgi:hypothetical protein